MGIKNVLARILQDIEIEGKKYFCNDVVSLPVKLASAHEKSGVVDTDADAVAYARDELGKTPIDHVTEDAAGAASGEQPAATGGAAAPVPAQGAADGQGAAQTGDAATDPVNQATGQQ